MENDLNFEQNANGVYVHSQPVKRLRSFYGKMIDQMPLLLSGKDEKGKIVDVPRTPMTPKRLVEERVNGQDNKDRGLLRDNNIYTPHAVCIDPDSDEATLAPYSNPIIAKLMNGLNPKTKLDRGAIYADTQTYQEIKSSETSYTLSRDIANDLRNNPYSQVEAREGVWDHLLEGDSELREKSLELVIRLSSFFPDETTMKERKGLFLPPRQFKGIRPLIVCSISYGSNVGTGNINDHTDTVFLVGEVIYNKEMNYFPLEKYLFDKKKG